MEAPTPYANAMGFINDHDSEPSPELLLRDDLFPEFLQDSNFGGDLNFLTLF